MPEISQTGVFVDTKTGQVVTSRPEEGIQLVAPGGEITPAAQADIDRAKEAAAGSTVETAPAESVVVEEPAPASSRAKK